MSFKKTFSFLFILLFSVASLKWASATRNSSVVAAHPLDPLSDLEIREAVKIIYHTRPDIQHLTSWTFNWITLEEPSKVSLLPYFLNDDDEGLSNADIPRKALVILQEIKANIITEVVVNLDENVVEKWTDLPHGIQPTITPRENADAEVVAKEDPEVQRRCREMGWFDMDLTVGEVWAAAYKDDRPILKNALRPIQVYMFGKVSPLDNHFAHPFDFVVTVDMALRKVILIDNLPTHGDYNADNRDGNKCPITPANYIPKLLPSNFYREDVHPVLFSQPNGAGYSLRGNQLSWQKFKFRLGFNAREGLVLYEGSYTDKSQGRRPLFYRMSVAELFVPYGDPRPPYYEKFTFDEGEFALGYSSIDLKAGDLCRGGEVAYMNVFVNNEKGEPYLQKNCVCIHEEDAGILYSHWARDGRMYQARSTRLTLSFYTNLGNYDYKISWKFYQDATIEFNAELHGALMTNLLAEGVTDTMGFGTVVAPQIDAQYHQHFLTVRMDLEVDGNRNTVSTVDIVAVKEASGSKKNPYGNGFTVEEKPLLNPTDARTNINPLTGRSWMIRNSDKLHPYTKRPVGWKLLPFNGPPPFLRKDSPLHPRAAYNDFAVWVTKYKEGQLFPDGIYSNGTGLPEWVEQDPHVNIKQEDVVLWYNYGFTHIPRVEDYPIMPTESSGFYLKPINFFLQNPALDVPPFVGQVSNLIKK